MKIVFLNRFPSDDQGTYGILFCYEINFKCFTIELPWKENKNSISCIPKGEYIVKLRWSKKYKYHYHVTDVHGRSWILFHSGNYAGDASKGLKTHSHGCILLGQKIGFLQNQKAVLNSRTTVSKFMEAMNKETFKLIIL